MGNIIDDPGGHTQNPPKINPIPGSMGGHLPHFISQKNKNNNNIKEKKAGLVEPSSHPSRCRDPVDFALHAS